MSEQAIVLNELTKHYGKHRGINNLSFSVNQGEFFGFIGPNGAGKSTTIRTLMGLIRPTGGSASIFGSDFHVFVIAVLAGQIAHILGNDAGLGVTVQTKDRCAASGGTDQAHQRADGGGFSCPVGANEAEKLALIHRETEVIDPPMGSIVLGQLV